MSYSSALHDVLENIIAPAGELACREGKFPREAVAALGRAGLLGLTCSAQPESGGTDLARAAEVVAQVMPVCPATAAVLQSHYAAAAVVEAYGGRWLRGEVAAGRHLCTLAVVEDGAAGAVRSTARRAGGVVALRARKRDVVAAGEADSYVWSSPSVGVDGGLTLWGVPGHAPGLFVPARATGAPLASATSTVVADPVRVPAEAMLGADGEGFEMLLGAVLPWLLELCGVVGSDAVHPSLGALARSPSGAARTGDGQAFAASAAMALR
ncbi:acyl-CoA dehydrogenase family protein [Streptomyces sp. NPDC096354]|uniref:acyl-CoA dehydrogenase family protein n=1 Tax=Streptomyces sp. NPDC096354 TaxID=3366088 RepID=UPI003819E260